MRAHFRAQLACVRDALFPRRMCAKKARYRNEAMAKAVLRNRQPHEPARLYAYECPECRGWHITKMEQPA